MFSVEEVRIMRLLIVEDEEKAAQFLKKGLSEAGFAVDVVHDGEEGGVAAQMNRYDLLIVDVNLPGRSGIQVIEGLRAQGNSTPVIVLTARDSVEDRVSGIDAGANVYLVKPFSFSEVLAYVRQMTSRVEREVKPVHQLVIGGLEIDFSRQKARRGKKSLDLTAKEFSILSLFARRRGQVLQRAVIAEEVWGINYDPGTNVIDVHIRRLRSKIDDDFENKLIWTVRGSGYVLEDRSQEGKDE